MPELPEVETVRRGLAKLAGRRIVAFQRYTLLLRVAVPDLHFLAGATLGEVQRLAKFLIWPVFREQQKLGSLLIHFGMSGVLHQRHQHKNNDPHVHWLLKLDQGDSLCYRDIRKFGQLEWLGEGTQTLTYLKKRFGHEPLQADFHTHIIAQGCQKKKQTLKAWLLAGATVAGLGNIYACESLFQAALSPFRIASSLTWGECVFLNMAIRRVLHQAVVAGGTTLRDFSASDARPGYFQQQLWVYGQQGKDCPRCRQAIACVKQAGRSTYYCSSCQN